jgi:hypothetical protein
MGDRIVLNAIAESCPFDALLVRNMRTAVNTLLQLNLKRFRVPQVSLAKYSALDIMKQALELLYEFSPSEKNYREAMRTIRVYSEGDEEMFRVLQESFRRIANAIYNAYSGQRHAESIAPKTLFLQGIPFLQSELQQSFRFVGVKPPDISPPSVKRTIFLDEHFEPYSLLLSDKITQGEAQIGREEHWAKIIHDTLTENSGTALIRSGTEHLDIPHSTVAAALRRIRHSETGSLSRLLQKDGIEVRLICRIADVNDAFGK